MKPSFQNDNGYIFLRQNYSSSFAKKETFHNGLAKLSN